jgi:hypothetical protein
LEPSQFVFENLLPEVPDSIVPDFPPNHSTEEGPVPKLDEEDEIVTELSSTIEPDNPLIVGAARSGLPINKIISDILIAPL